MIQLSENARGKLPATTPAAKTKRPKRKRKHTPGNGDDSDVTTSGGGARPARPPYSQEQDDFIRFCRDDLCQSWEGCQRLYNQHWAAVDKASERKIPGLQSRYYRLLDVPVRDRKRGSLGRPELGILATTTRRYWWMQGMYTDEERAEAGRERQNTRESTDLASSNREPTTSGSGAGEDDYEVSSDEEMLDSFPATEDSDGGEQEHVPDRDGSPCPKRQDIGKGKASGDAGKCADFFITATSDEENQDDIVARLAKIKNQLNSRVRASTSPSPNPGNADQRNQDSVEEVLRIRRQDPSVELDEDVDMDMMHAIRVPMVPGTARVSRKIMHRKRSLRGDIVQSANLTPGEESTRGPLRTAPPQDVNPRYPKKGNQNLQNAS
jgi:hypothetical protein